jgi:hypothetical protein
MRAEQQLRASFKEIDELKAALDEHASVASPIRRGNSPYINDKFSAISKCSGKKSSNRVTEWFSRGLPPLQLKVKTHVHQTF